MGSLIFGTFSPSVSPEAKILPVSGCASPWGDTGALHSGPCPDQHSWTVLQKHPRWSTTAPALLKWRADDWFWKKVIPSGKCSSKLEQSQTCAGGCGFPRGGENHSWVKTWSKTTCSVAHLWKVIRNITDLPLSSLPLLYPDRAFPSLL